MALPIVPIFSEDVEVGDETVTVHGLSRAAAIRLTTAFSPETADDAEAFVLAQGTGVTDAEAREWLSGVDVVTGGLLVDKIIELSRLPKSALANNK